MQWGKKKKIASQESNRKWIYPPACDNWKTRLNKWNSGFQDIGHRATKCSNDWWMENKYILSENRFQDEGRWNQGIVHTRHLWIKEETGLTGRPRQPRQDKVSNKRKMHRVRWELTFPVFRWAHAAGEEGRNQTLGNKQKEV